VIFHSYVSLPEGIVYIWEMCFKSVDGILLLEFEWMWHVFHCWLCPRMGDTPTVAIRSWKTLSHPRDRFWPQHFSDQPVSSSFHLISIPIDTQLQIGCGLQAPKQDARKCATSNFQVSKVFWASCWRLLWGESIISFFNKSLLIHLQNNFPCNSNIESYPETSMLQ